MKKKIVAVLMASVMACGLWACESSSNTKEETKTEKKETKKEESVTYQTILDDYSNKIKEEAPKLVEEYNSESKDKAGDINALAELSNSKVEKLAEICNEGVQKMADLMLKNKDDQATYEEWAGKLQDVYTEYSKQITDAYTNSTSNMSADDLMKSLQQ